MTPRQRKAHKLGNAVRAWRGGPHTHQQAADASRAMRWTRRCQDAGIISASTATTIRSRIYAA